jgi:uncharacterized repeat protein (TIGR02543 family)
MFFLGVFLTAAVLIGCAQPNMLSSGGQPNDSSGMVKITFAPNGGDWTGISVYSWEIVSTIPKSSAIVFPSRPPAYRNGVLAGWYTNAMSPLEPDEQEPEGKLQEGTLIQHDMTVYALWRLKPIESYVVAFKQYEDDANPVYVFATKENGYRVDAAQIPPLNERMDWDAVTGEGVWWTEPDSGVTFDEHTVVSGDMSVYGHWSGKIRTIFFNMNEGTWPALTNIDDFTYFPPVEFPYAPVDGDVLPYVQVQYPVTTIPAIPVSRPVKKDFNTGNYMMFLGWTLDPDPALAALDAEAQISDIVFFDLATKIDRDSTVYAVWQIMLDTQMAIVFNLYNGLTVSKAANFEGSPGFLAESNFPAAPVRPGYDFAGWYLSPSGGDAFTVAYEVSFGAKNPANADGFNVYALWSPQQYTVNYLLNYEDAGEYTAENAPGTAVFPASTVAVPPPPSRPGWAFCRWNRRADGSGAAFDGTGVYSSMDVYAVWSVVPSSEIQSQYNDGGSIQTIIVPHAGWYRIELWGAKGNDVTSPLNNKGYGGRGAYTKGNVYLQAGEELFLFIGGSKPGTTGGFNGGGGGRGQERGAGGGATDVRILNSMDSAGLASRIMVAGGGGGGSDARYSSESAEGSGPNLRYNGGAGGTIRGCDAEGDDFGKGGTQTAGGGTSVGSYAQYGLFGKGGTPRESTLEMIGGGGGGWWGGGSGGRHSSNGGGGGGSSFISGYPGCIATSAQFGFSAAPGPEDSIEKAASWTEKIFTHAVMRSGAETMPAPNGGTQTGHNGPGYARITSIGPVNEQ